VVHIALPAIHCAGCIAGVERVLAAAPGLRAARVNLGRRRVRAVVAPGQGAAPALTALRAAGYEAHELDDAALGVAQDDAAGRGLLARMAVAGFGMMNVMALSVAVWSGAAQATEALFQWIAAAIALPTLIFAAVPFFNSAGRVLLRGRVNMDVPIALAILLATASSLHETVLGSGRHTWFEAALMLTLFLLVGRYLDHRARASARSAAAELTALEIPRATILDGEARRTIAVADISIGDRIALSAGARAPVDGVAEGDATLDRSAITGEAAPAAIRAGDAVCAGEAVIGGPVTLRATATAEDSTLRRLAALVDVAETGRHRYSGVAERAAALYAPFVHALAAIGFAGWWLCAQDLHTAIGVATSVLIITCPCALALAVPAVTAHMTAQLFRNGVLLKSETALERLADVNCVLFDKTGTLTEGAAVLPDLNDEVAGIVLALARASDHPVSRALSAALAGRTPQTVTAIRDVAGDGVYGMWRGTCVHLGRAAHGNALHIGVRTIALPIEERLRPGAVEAVAALQASGYEVRMVTGDDDARARAMAGRVGITHIHAALRPEEKSALVARLQSEGRRVLMVGDGINDAVALSTAAVSLAPASALDAARVASDGVLLSADLQAVPRTLTTGRRALRRIRQNLWISSAYNVVAIPIAMIGIATPLIAALAMSASSLSVVGNAVRR
ncbi:MAG: heavy metal translocating P-type ATPase, partial [Pseudomonadota bacterium]